MPARLALLLGAAVLVSAGGGAAFAAETGDPHADQQFGLDQVRAPAAWATTTGSGAVIAVVDSGVDLEHPDLDGKLLPGATFLACGTVSCGNGDWRSGPQERRDDDSPHGTHVAGITAAETGNGIGVAGVAPDASILPVKVIDAAGGSFADIAAGIRWSVDQGADVINLSLGGPPGTQVLTFTGLIGEVQDAIEDARARGVVVVAAAGNDFAAPVCATPGFDRGAVCVVATDKREQRAAYSNLAVNQDLKVVAGPGGSAAPVCGENVVSTVPAEVTGHCGYATGYREYAGTSMAAPHVSGVVALLAAQGRTGDEIVELLLTTSRQPLTDLRGAFTPSHGFGIVDAAAAAAAPGAATPTGSPSPSASPTAATSASPTASATASPAPAESPSATSSPTPTTSASPSPTTTPTASATPSPTTSPTATADPTAQPTESPGASEPPVEPAPPRSEGVTRLAGPDRFGTSAAVSQASFPGTANDVFVVTGGDWVDALSAGPAAARLNGPVLPVLVDGVPSAIGEEITRLQPLRAWIIGGPAVVGEQVMADLRARGIEVRRVDGADRYATAAAVAAEFFPDPGGAYYASGSGYADALGGGAAAAHRGWPLLLTSKDRVPAGTPAVGSTRIVLGGPSVISEQVRAELGARRVSGADRYSTAVAIAQDAFAAADVAYLATGLNFPDALAAAPAAARDAAPVLLAAQGCVTQATRDEIARLGASSRVVLGGTSAVSDEAADLTAC